MCNNNHSLCPEKYTEEITKLILQKQMGKCIRRKTVNITCYWKEYNQTDNSTTAFLNMPLRESNCTTSGTQNTKASY